MLDAYRSVLARPGTLAFSAAGVVARMPLSMVGLGIVLLVSQTTGSYGLAGAVSAAYTATNAVFSVPQGRLLDRLGQPRVLTIAAFGFAIALSVVAVSAYVTGPWALTFGAAAVAGACLPAVGACVRARWSHVLDRPAHVHTAYALESVADEVVFISGPVLVTLLATAWHPLAGLGAAIVTGLGGTLALAAQRGTAPPPHPPTAERPTDPMPWRRIAVIAVVCLMLGGLFGAAEVAAVGFSEEQGARGLSGPLLALWATGSLVAGIATGAVHWRMGPAGRLRWGTAALTVAMAPVSLIGSMPVMAAALFVGGFAVAPTLIATNSLTEQTVPRSRLVEGMAIVHTGIAAGVAPGAALAGALIDASGASVAFVVPAVAGLLAALAAQLIRSE